MNENSYVNEKIAKEFEKLMKKGKERDIEDGKIFKMIGKLDSKFEDDIYYKINIGGIIANIGIERKSIKLLNEAIRRVKDSIENTNNEFSLNKLKFDIGNIINTKADIKYSNNSDEVKYNDIRVNILLDLEEYLEARYYYTQVRYDLDNFDTYIRANTNSANILDLYGRNYESIMLYDRVLNIDPDFGMALGNKAIAIIRYYTFTPDQYKENTLLILAKKLFERAMKNKSSIIEVGSERALNSFKFHISRLNKFIEENNIDNEKLSKDIEDDYKSFVLNQNLFLNYHFGFAINDNSLKDNIIPPFISNIEDSDSKQYSGFSKKLFYSIKQLNQIIEDFTSARYMYYFVNSSQLEEKNDITDYIYALDYTRNNLKYGLMKTIFTKLFNILDKIANFLSIYFDMNQGEEDIYFNDLIGEKYKKIVKEKDNSQLLALYGLALDFEKGHAYYKLRKLRNKLVHEFIDIKELDFKDDVEDGKYKDYHISVYDFNENIQLMFQVTKAAILYLNIALEIEGERAHKRSNGKIGHLQFTKQNDIYKDSS